MRLFQTYYDRYLNVQMADNSFKICLLIRREK